MSWRRDLLNRAAPYLPRRVLVMRGPAAKKQIALTFDDGPDEMTGEYVSILERLRVSATFFLVGENCIKYPAGLAALSRAGHELAGHGYTHKRFPDLSPQALADELSRTAALLPPPRRRPIVRPPQGRATPRSLYECGRHGYSTVLWSLDSDDWTARDAETVVAKVSPERVRPGEIVLLHEGQTWTLAALPALVENLRAAGYAFVRLSELVWP